MTSILTHLDNAVRGIANGMTFGLADKLEAAASTLYTSKSYDENLKQQADINKDGGPEYTAGVVIGSLLPGQSVLKVGVGSVRASINGSLATLMEKMRWPLEDMDKLAVAQKAMADLDWETALSREDDRQDYGERRVQVFGLLGRRLHVAGHHDAWRDGARHQLAQGEQQGGRMV